MAFKYMGKCQRCHFDAGYLDDKRVHIFAGLFYSGRLYRDGNILCESPVFEGDEF